MSPLIATILLIAFAVSIGAVIMSYGNAYYSEEPTTEKTPDEICKDVIIEFYEIDGLPQICLSQTEDKDVLSFILLNKGGIDIDGVQVLASLRGQTNSVDIIDLEDSSISRGFPLEKEVVIDNTKGSLVQVQLIAELITDEDKTFKCFLDPISVDRIRKC